MKLSFEEREAMESILKRLDFAADYLNSGGHILASEILSLKNTLQKWIE